LRGLGNEEDGTLGAVVLRKKETSCSKVDKYLVHDEDNDDDDDEDYYHFDGTLTFKTEKAG
jgi:hypothetical protein